MKAVLLAALFAVVGTCVAENPRRSESRTPPAATLGFIETSDRSIEIKASRAGSYTVRSKDGRILAENISASKLQAMFPKLHQIVRGVAWNTDASVNVMRRATWNNDAGF
jgi:hypothetical protein